MKSNVCKIDNGTKDLAAILKESEKVAEYNELTHKQALQLRLICEEIDGMLPNIIGEFNGDFWIDFEEGVCRVNVSLRFEEFTAKKKEELVAIAKNKKNASVTGVVGMIRSILEDVFLEEDSFEDGVMSLEARYFLADYYNSMDYYPGVSYSHVWSLDQYKNTVKTEKKTEKWDELEKSVLASVADDVLVGVKGRQADIIVVKKFA